MRAAEDRPGLDEEALLLVVRNPVRRFVRRLVAEPALAEDAASETLLAVMERLRAGLRLRRPVSFALQVAWTKALEVRRRASRDLQAEVPERPHVADPASTAELRDWLDSGLAALEPVDRALLHLRYVEDLSYRELGHVLGEPVGTIGRRLHDARVALKDRLERAGRGRTSEATLIALLPRLGGADVGGPPSSLARPTRWIEAATRAATRRRFVASLTLAIAAGASAWKLAGADPAPAAAGVAPATLVADAPRSPAYTSGAAPALLRAPAPRPTGVRGRVVDERDAGVAGAVLRWTPSRRTRRGGSEPTTPPSAAEGRATADGDGRFDFVPAGGATLFDLVAEAPGFAPTRRDDVPIGAVDVTLRLGPGLAVSGTVADLDGRPVAGAVVVYHARLGDRPVTAATTSASDGRYAFEHLPIDPAVRRIDAGALEVTAEGRAPQIKPLGAALPGERPGRLCADVRLARGAVLEGTVRDPAGAPIAEAEVELWMNAAAEAPARPGFPVPASDPAAARRILRGRTDRSGRYRLEHVPVRVAGIEPGSRYALFNTRRESAFLAGGLVVAAPGRAATGAVVLLADADEAVVTVDVVLPPAVTLSGVARDAHGAPLSGGVVKARLASDDLQQATTAVDRIRGRDALAVAAIDAAGAWRLTDLPPVAPPGRLEISAEAPGVATHVVAWSEGAARDLELSAIPTRSIRGVVVDDRGAPVAGAVVTLGPPSRRAEIAATATDLDGAFEATLPRDVVAAEWRVSHPGRAQLRLPWTARDVDVEHDAPLRLVLAPERTLRGTVRSAEGLPVAGALVAAFPVDVSGALPPLASLEGDPSRAYAETATDSAGAFALTGLPAGPACLRVGVPWPRNDGLVALLLGRKFCVVTSAPETAEPAVITLPAYRAERGALVVHAAETSTGAPILRGLKGALHAPDGMVGGFGIVAGPGLLVFHDVPVGTYRLAVEAAGFAETAKSDVTVGGAAGSPEVRVELERGARLVGRTRRDGAHAAGATFVRARRFSGAPELRVPCRDDGTFEVEGLSAGAWRVWAEVQEDGVPPAMISRTERVALEIGRTAPPLDLRLLPVEPTTLRLSGMFDGRAAPTLDKRSPAWGDMVRRFGEHRLTCRDAGGAEWIDVALDAVPYQLDGRDVVFHLPLPRGFYDVVASRAERKVAALRIASPGRAEADVSEE